MRRLAGLLLVLTIVASAAGPATAAPLLEKDVNLDEANRLRDILVAQGIDVVMTRTGDTNPALADRAHLGGQGDILISVHNNSSDSPSARGTEVYAQIDNPESMALAQRILDGVVRDAGTESRGALTRQGEHGDYYSILRNSPVPAVIVEGAFLSNPDEAADLASPAFRQRLAQGIADGVIADIGPAPRLGPGPTPPKALVGSPVLGAPQAVSAARHGGTIDVTWAPVLLANAYEVWKDGALVGTGSALSFHDAAPGPGRHVYEVRGALGLGSLQVVEGPTTAANSGGATVVIDPGHGGEDSGAVGDI